jgi:hypothetical protein
VNLLRDLRIDYLDIRSDHLKNCLRKQRFLKSVFSVRVHFEQYRITSIISFSGITPYASILSSLLAQYRDRNCCGASFGSQKRLIKLDFVWIHRSMDNFEWFLKVLANFEKEQTFCENIANKRKVDTINDDNENNNGRFLDIHLYFTDIKQDVNIGSVPLDLVTRVYEQACHEDILGC